MHVTRKLTTGLSAGVLGLGVVFAGASSAAAADLPELTVTPNPVGVTETFELRGSACVTGDTPGVANVTMIYPDGHDEFAGSYNADASGAWYAAFKPNEEGAVPAGTYTIKATCDTYEGTLSYPDIQFDAIVIDGPAASATSTSLAPGANTTVNVSGFAPGVDVTLQMVPSTEPDATPVTLAAGATDANGEASIAVTIPADTAPGGYTIRAVGSDGTVVGFDITVGSATQTQPVSHSVSGPELAATGVSAGGLGLLAGGLLLSGGAALYAGRRTRR